MSPSRTKSGSAAGARPAKPVLAPADKLKREIQAALTEELRSDEHDTQRLHRVLRIWQLRGAPRVGSAASRLIAPSL